jgi:pimeloyl-ACP methyl ester carboxylesterase
MIGLHLALCALTALASPDTLWVQNIRVTVNRAAQVSDTPVLVVALHGDLGGREQDEFAAKAAAANRDVIVIGLLRPGYTDPQGHTSKGERGFTTGDNYNAANTDAIAGVIAELRQRFHARRVVLAGHSGGAAITANILGRHPDLAQAALLVSCPCDVVAWRQHMLEQTKYEGFRGSIETLSPIDQIDGMSNDVRVTMVVGARDNVAPPSLDEAYKEKAVKLGKHVGLVQLDGKEHDIFLEPGVLAPADAPAVAPLTPRAACSADSGPR